MTREIFRSTLKLLLLMIRMYRFLKTCYLFKTWLRSSPPKVFLGKGVLKICSKFTGFWKKFLNSELNNGGMKYRSREFLKAIFKNNKRVDKPCMKFYSIFNASVQSCLYPLFQNQRPHFLLLYIFLKNVSTLRSESTKW